MPVCVCVWVRVCVLLCVCLSSWVYVCVCEAVHATSLCMHLNPYSSPSPSPSPLDTPCIAPVSPEEIHTLVGVAKVAPADDATEKATKEGSDEAANGGSEQGAEEGSDDRDERYDWQDFTATAYSSILSLSRERTVIQRGSSEMTLELKSRRRSTVHLKSLSGTAPSLL